MMATPSRPARFLGVLTCLAILAGCNRPSAPEATAPVEVAARPDVLMQDDFSDPSSGWKEVWFEGTGASHGAEYADGRLRVWVDNDENTYDINLAAPGKSFDDVRLEVDVERVSGTSYSGAFLMCRADALSGSFYYFKLDGDGLAHIGVYLGGEEMHVVFKEVPAGLLQPVKNRLGASCIGNTLGISVNGQLVFEVEKTDLSRGDVGVGVGGDDTGDTEVRFDDFVAYPPQAPDSAVAGVTTGQAGDPGSVEPAPAVLPPGDYLEALQAGVDEGTWSYEDGLLAILRAFAGQDAGTLEVMEPGDREGTGVVLEAQRYVREGDDAAVRAEVESLLQVILPDPDRIRPYARPEGQASLRPRGLAAPAAEPLCQDLYKQGFPEGAGVICYVFAQELLGGLSIEVFWPSEWSSGSTEYAFAKAALEAVKDSLVYFQGLGMKAGGVQVVFALLPLTDSENHVSPHVLASVPSAGGATGCLIPVYPFALQYYASAPIGLPGFKQTIAHEMFHCFQGWNYPEHFDEWGLQRWWGEGSADYFSNLVYPKVNKEWGRRASFVALSTELPIFKMAYENTFFFQFLEKKIQPSGLLQMFHLLPTGKPWSEHQKILSEYPGMADYWHEFARAIIDDSLVDTGGMTIPMGDDWTDTVAILKTDDYDMPARDFVLTRYNLMLGGGLGYHVQVAETDVEVLAEVRPATTAAWTPVSIDRDTGCAHYFAIVTSAGSQSQPRTFRVDGTVDQPTGPGGACDACVVGRWRMTHTSYMNMYNAVMSDAGEAAPFSTGASGDLFFDIRDDGTLDAVADSFGVKAIGGIPDSQGDPLYTETTLNLNGKTEMTYVAMDGALVMQVVTQGISTKLVVAIAGTEFETPMGADGGGGIGSGAPGSITPYKYACDPAYLTLEPLLHPELYKGNYWEFQKVKP